MKIQLLCILMLSSLFLLSGCTWLFIPHPLFSPVKLVDRLPKNKTRGYIEFYNEKAGEYYMTVFESIDGQEILRCDPSDDIKSVRIACVAGKHTFSVQVGEAFKQIEVEAQDSLIVPVIVDPILATVNYRRINGIFNTKIGEERTDYGSLDLHVAAPFSFKHDYYLPRNKIDQYLKRNTYREISAANLVVWTLKQRRKEAK
jgi:hypothetical protein